MTRTEAEPARHRVPARRRGDQLIPETLPLWGLTDISHTEATQIRDVFVQGSYCRKGVVIVRQGCDTTVRGLEGSTEGTVEFAADLDERALKALARIRPYELIRMIDQGDLDPPKLTFAAEAVGQISKPSLAIPVLFQLLEHESPLVREGAIYGLENQPSSDEVVEILTRVATEDPSPGVKLAASDVLAEL